MFLCMAVVVGALSSYYVRTHPLVFNESFWDHAHCIKQAGMSLLMYAHDNHGQFPFHTNGYGDALLLVSDAWLPSFTGPGYDSGVLERVRRSGGDVPESECGRGYIQGLSETNSPEIALLFDKIPNPGDHRHFLSRVVSPLVREVSLIDGSMRVIQETDWSAFSKRQIELLVAAGIARQQAEAYYSENPNR